MALHNDPVHNVLRHVNANVFYLVNDSDNSIKSNDLPYIVMQVVSRRPVSADDTATIYSVEYQVTLVTRKRSEALVKRLERMLNDKDLVPVLVSSYQNEDYSMSRVYQINILSQGGY